MPSFIIIENTKRTLFKVAGNPVVLNQEYDLSLQATIEIVNTLGYPAEPMDNFKYQIKDGDINSVNTGNVNIVFLVDKTTLPLNYNDVKEIQIFEFFKFSDLIPPASNYDRIQITELSGKGNWSINGSPIIQGQVIYYYQLDGLLQFTADETGWKNNYNILKWKFGHSLGFYDYENSISVSTKSNAELDLQSPIAEVIKVGDIESSTFNISVKNGPENGSFKLKIDTTNFSNIGTPAENKLFVFDGTNTIQYDTSGIFDYTNNLNAEGLINLEFIVQKKYPYSTAGSVEVDLIEINNSSSNIDLTKNHVEFIIPISEITP